MTGAFDLFAGLELQPPARSRARRRNGARRRPAARAPQWSLAGAINVVLFAGMGGADEGLEDAGFPVHVAVNHDEVAIAAHKALNPHTEHLWADICEVCPLVATRGRPVGILWMSPDCTHHSVAKGGAPVSPRVRSLPWQGCRWVGVLRKRGLGPVIFHLENVREIRSWGPLIAKRCKQTGRVLKLDGSVAAPGERVPRHEQQLVADPRRKGRTYRAWLEHMKRLGARYEDRDLTCADYGVPTSRKRLFGTGVFDDQPIGWPMATHARRQSEAAQTGKLIPYRAAAECIDWSLDLPSIFGRKKELAAATQKRVAVGFKRFVAEAEKPFLLHITHGGRLHDMGEPYPTVTCAHRGELAVVGAAIVPTTHTTDRARVHDGRDGLPVLTAGVKGGELAVGAAYVTTFRKNSVGHSPEDPTLTFTSQHSDHHPGGAPPFGVVAASLIGVAHGDDGRSGSRTYDIKDALRVVTGSNDQAVIGAAMIRTDMHQSNATCAFDVVDPTNTIMTSGGHAVLGATMIQTGYGERDGQAPRALDLEEPIGTQMAGGAKHAVVGAWMIKNSTGVTGLPLEEPVSGLVTKEGPQAVGAAYMTEFRGTSADGQPMTEPAGTMCAGGDRGGGHHAVTVGYLCEYYGTGGQHQACDQPLNTSSTRDRFAVTGADLATFLPPEKVARARQVAEFLRAHGCWDGGEIVTLVIDGTTWIVLDIGMRMLTPREAAAAHELRLPKTIRIRKRDRKGNVVLDDAGEPVWIERPLTKTEAMRLVGNSVPKRMAMLLAQANLHHTHTLYAPAVPAVAAE